MKFEKVKNSGDWKPIWGCPGRFVLRGASPELSITDLLSDEANVRRFESPKAKDAVFVAPLDRGGIISYRQMAGTWVHTLCTEEGFRRKLEQLGIGVVQNQ
ncbi:MAG: hypothetical protein R2747_08650 [Pyrinomonadaceae bacterium]